MTSAFPRSVLRLFGAASLLLSLGAVADVVLNEVCWKNDRFDDGSGTKTSDWVELYNNGSDAVDVGGYALGKKKSFADCGEKICVLPSYALDPGEFLVVYFNKDLPSVTNWVETVVGGRTKRVPWVRSNVFSLGTAETELALYQDDVRLFDNTAEHNRVSNIKGEDVAVILEKNTSWGALWDGNVDTRGETAEEGWVVLATATPWASNAAGFTMAAPTLSAETGVAVQKITVKARCPDARAATLYYTLDGSDPRTSATRVARTNGGTIAVEARAAATATSGKGQTNAWIRTSPVELEARVPGAGWRAPIGTVPRHAYLRVVAAYGPGFSAESRGVYCVGAPFANSTLPVLALTVDPDDFFSFERGLYVPGAPYAARGYGTGKWGKPNANYFADDCEVRSRIDLFEPGAAQAALSCDLGVSVTGGGARALPQKALACALRGSEYGTRSFTYDLIPDLGTKTYRRFVLDVGGNDWYGPLTEGVPTLLKETVLHRIAFELGLAEASRPAVVTVNGDYWGLHALREATDKHGFATRAGLDAENIDLLEHAGTDANSDVVLEAVEGGTAALADYAAFLDRLADLDVATDAGYAAVQRVMDVTNYADYVITEAFFANDDWPAENCRFWRTRTNELNRADQLGDGRWRWRLSGLDLAGKAKDGVAGVDRDLLAALSARDMKDHGEPAFLINELWKNAAFREFFIDRTVALLETTFHPDRTAAIVRAAADAIAPEVERHARRWGRSFTQKQWSAAVEGSLVDYLAQRWTNSFEHLSAKFDLGGVGELTVSCGGGGTLVVDGETVAGTSWTGRRFAGRPVRVTAVAPAGSVFVAWSDGVREATRTVAVTARGTRTLSARFARVVELYGDAASDGIAAGETAPWLEAAVVYDGFIAEAATGLRGTLQVKVGKANRRTQRAKVTAVFTPADGTRKVTFRNGSVGSDGRMEDWTQNGLTLRLLLGVRALGGTLDGVRIDGARNLFTSKNAGEKQEAADVLARTKTGCALAWPAASVAGKAPGTGWNGLAVTVGTKGKTKVSGTLASGVKVSVSGQLLLGETRLCVPVVSTKKETVALEVWGTRTGGLKEPEVVGADEVVAGGIGGACAGLFESCELPEDVRLGSGGYEGWRPRVTAKTGALKGTFKVYAGTNGKYRKTAVSVVGIVVDGVGYGTAVLRNRASWAVLLR